jgi:hypothetical protein
MKKIYDLLIALAASAPLVAFSQNNMPVHAFQPSEKISYTVYYNVLGIYVDAGSATFTTSSEKLDNSDVFHVVGEGSTNPKYDWIFKVRDRYESYFNSKDLQPVKFVRQINEGKFQKHEEVTFNPHANTATTNTGVYKVPENVQDVVSVLYYARNINYDQYHTGDKIPFSMFLDDKVYNMYIHYMGKETIQTKYGKFNAIKLKPLLLKGSVFDGGEDMTIWVTDDSNHIPVRIESPIIVGTVKVDLMHYENLKYPVTMVQ